MKRGDTLSATAKRQEQRIVLKIGITAKTLAKPAVTKAVKALLRVLMKAGEKLSATQKQREYVYSSTSEAPDRQLHRHVINAQCVQSACVFMTGYLMM